MIAPSTDFFPEETLTAVTASLPTDAVEMLSTTQIEGPVIDGAAGQRALPQFIASEQLIGLTRLHHESDAFLILEINPSVGGHRRG